MPDSAIHSVSAGGYTVHVYPVKGGARVHVTSDHTHGVVYDVGVGWLLSPRAVVELEEARRYAPTLAEGFVEQAVVAALDTDDSPQSLRLVEGRHDQKKTGSPPGSGRIPTNPPQSRS